MAGEGTHSSIARRNAELIAAYLGGMRAPDVADAFGMTVAAVKAVLYRAKVRLPEAERARRCKIGGCQEKTERNAALFADYRGGLTRAELAEKYELAPDRVHSLLYRHKVHLAPAERQRRLQLGRLNSRSGRRPVWPDCPPELVAEYRRLRVSYGYRAGEARAMLEQSHAMEGN